MAVNNKKYRLICWIFIFTIFHSALFANNLVYEDNRKIGVEISKQFEKGIHQKIDLERQLNLFYNKQMGITPSPKKGKIEINIPQVVIDDVIVMLNDIPTEEVLAYNKKHKKRNGMTPIGYNSPG
jgi:hypothetical protein